MITVFSDDNKQLCDAVAEHLQTFNMVKQVGKIQVILRDAVKVGLSNRKYLVVVDDYCGQFSTTLQSVYNSAADFEAGYKAAKKEYEKGKKK